MRIYHTYSSYAPKESETRRRQFVAQESWMRERDRTRLWTLCPVAPGRTLDGMPFIRDILSAGAATRFGRDITAISNNDVSFITEFTDHIMCGVASHGAVYCHRWDFAKHRFPDKPVSNLSRAQVFQAATWYPGSDFFAFSSEWAMEYLGTFPDMVLGREAWDLTMRLMIRRGGGIEIHQGIYHEKHASYWELPGVKDRNPGNLHNRELCRKWIAQYGGSMNDWDNKPVFK
jgi:hypothetical protein